MHLPALTGSESQIVMSTFCKCASSKMTLLCEPAGAAWERGQGSRQSDLWWAGLPEWANSAHHPLWPQACQHSVQPAWGGQDHGTYLLSYCYHCYIYILILIVIIVLIIFIFIIILYVIWFDLILLCFILLCFILLYYILFYQIVWFLSLFLPAGYNTVHTNMSALCWWLSSLRCVMLSLVRQHEAALHCMSD